MRSTSKFIHVGDTIEERMVCGRTSRPAPVARCKVGTEKVNTCIKEIRTALVVAGRGVVWIDHSTAADVIQYP